MRPSHFMPFVVTGDLQCGECHNETLEDALFITCGYHMCSDSSVLAPAHLCPLDAVDMLTIANRV